MDYDPETGEFTWKRHPNLPAGWNAKWAGREAGKTRPDKYKVIRFKDQTYLAHRLAWLHTHGRWPTKDIDHDNNNPSDNRLANLRPATKNQNQWNGGPRKNNTSGYKGVRQAKHSGKWKAQICQHYKHHYLGTFDTPEEAHAAYCTAALELHGEFANFGRAA